MKKGGKKPLAIEKIKTAAEAPHLKLLKVIAEGIAADGTSGRAVLDSLGVKEVWPYDAFKVQHQDQDQVSLSWGGCRFKVSGKRFSGDVAVRVGNGGVVMVKFGHIKKKFFHIKDVFHQVAYDMLTPLIAAYANDPNAEIVYAAG